MHKPESVLEKETHNILSTNGSSNIDSTTRPCLDLEEEDLSSGGL